MSDQVGAGAHRPPATLDDVLAELRTLRGLLERENVCQHGGTGLCMDCLVPHIEAVGSQIVRQVAPSSGRTRVW